MENSNEQQRKQEKMLEERQEQINKLEATMKSVSAEVIKVWVILSMNLHVNWLFFFWFGFVTFQLIKKGLFCFREMK